MPTWNEILKEISSPLASHFDVIVLSVHHSTTITLTQTPTYKIIENQNGMLIFNNINNFTPRKIENSN